MEPPDLDEEHFCLLLNDIGIEKHDIFVGDDPYMNVTQDGHYQTYFTLNYCPFCGIQLRKMENIT